nr:hypothetical protein [Rickettsiella massiliensis]
MKVDDLVEVYKNRVPFPSQAYFQHFVASTRASISYLFKSDLAVEMGWQALQHTVLDEYVTSDHYSLNGDVEGFAWDLVAKKIIPIQPHLNLYATLGVAYFHPGNTKGGGHVAGTTGPSEFSLAGKRYPPTLEPIFGIGIRYSIFPEIAVDFSWHRLQAIRGLPYRPSIDFYSLGLYYYLG